jgi:hypothetical protein
MDPIIIRDTVAHVLFSIQFNLVAGTIAPYVMKRPDLRPVIEKILNFDVSYDESSSTIVGTLLTYHITVLASCSTKLAMGAMRKTLKQLRHCSPMAVLFSTPPRLEQESRKTNKSRRNTILTFLDSCHPQCP